MKNRICRFLALSCLVCLFISLEHSLAGEGSANQAGPLSPRAEFLETNAVRVFGTPTFIKSYKNFETAAGSEFESHDLSDILTTDDGGIVVAVRDTVYGPSDDAFYVVIMKLDRLGELEWQVVQAGCWGIGPIALVPSREGGFFVAFSIAFQSVGSYTPCVMRIGPTGVVQWIKSYSWRLENDLSSATATRDGGIVLAGTQGDTPNTISWLLKLDDSGRIVWQTRMEARASILAVKETPDAGLVAVGSRLGPEGVGHHALVIKMDGNAEVEWAETLPDARGWDIVASSVEPTIDGSYAVAGADDMGSVVWAGKLDRSGRLIWQGSWGPTNSILGPVQLLQAKEGGFLVISNSDSWGLALKLSPSGDLQWSRGYGGKTWIFRAAQARDHGYVLSGFWEGAEHLLLMRVDPNGNLGASCSYVHQVALHSAPPVLHSSRTSLARRPVSFLSVDLPYLPADSSCQIETLCLQDIKLPNPKPQERRFGDDLKLPSRR